MSSSDSLVIYSNVPGNSVPHENSPTKVKVTRSHPPRLQHSPSLPNIWFPPHSGPIPPQFEAITREPLQRPSTPPCSSARGAEGSSDPPKSTGDQESASLDATPTHLYQVQPLKIVHSRRKVDRDQSHGHPLLTPPLTPSSSLKTVTSVDSSAPTDTEHENKDERNQPTRFLLLGNISKQIRHDLLRSSIVASFTSQPETSKNHSTSGFAMHAGPLTEDAIKGFFLRCQQTDGVVMLAFFDVRHAEIAKQIIATPSHSPLTHCVGDDLTEDGTRAWITCRFIGAEELEEIIGKSSFLASTNASFYLAVESKKVADEVSEDLKITEDYGAAAISDVVQGNNSADADRIVTSTAAAEINTTMLESFLTSFGALRLFTAANGTFDWKSLQSPKIFHVEYYDVREANSAYSTLDGQVLFGMKLSVFGRKSFSEAITVQPHKHHPQLQVAALPTKSASSSFPINSIGCTNEPVNEFGPPGHYSRTRERYQHFEEAQSRPHGFIAPHNTLVDYTHQSPAPSPTYFYTSHTPEHQPPVSSPYDHRERDGSEDSQYVNNLGVQCASSSRPIENGGDWMGEDAANHPRTPGLYPYHDCYYCPSRATATSTPYECYGPCFTPSPYAYQPNQVLQTHQTAPFLPMLPPAHAYTLEFDNPYLRPMHLTTSTNIPFDQAVQPSRPLGNSPSAEALGNIQPTIHSGQYNTPTNPIGRTTPQYAPIAKQDPPLNMQSKGAYPKFRPSSSIASSHALRGTRMAHSQGPGSSRESRIPTEHNQLNLSRIEDGQDTRTTVMIKNIPNKMSDKDLITYIGKVCPRRIDFLYLRMDFQNGCNVGYAFVNFITVQDLLTFAKRKLGEKWNMFSSEKVLQMSYATYQGKEALVEKFKNSCIMDVQEAWRPKIFYSEPGPEQGLPEPFPAPTHIRRKERSAFNRGALYVPGVGNGAPPPSSSIPRRFEETQKRSDRPSQSSEQNALTFPSIGTSYNRRSNAKSWGGSKLDR